MPPHPGSVDPRKAPDQLFELHSIPAHDRGKPDVVRGHEIGSTKQRVKPDDVLLAKIVPHIRRAHVVGPTVEIDQIASSEWMIFRSPAVNPGYLRHFLIGDTFHSRFMATVAGVGGSLLRARPQYVKKITIPLPPLPEQRRIAAILDEADAIRAKRRAQLAHLDELPQALFHEMFGEEPLETRPLGTLGLVSSGITKGRRTSERTRLVPYLAVANVQAGTLALGNVKEIEATDREIDRYSLQTGDVVLTEGGDPDKLGRGAVWRGEIGTCLHQNHIFRLRFPEGSDVRPEYVSGVLQRRDSKQYFLRSAKRTTGIASINMTQLRALPIPVPDLASQDAYLNLLDAVRAERDRVARALEADDELFSALQHRAFRGEL